MANIAALVLESVPAVGAPGARWFFYFEAASVGVFTIEYVLRLWSCGEDERYAGLRGRARFAASPLAVIDLLAVLPFYVPFLLPMDLRALRVFRLARLFRLFKLGRYFESFRIMARVLANKREDIVITLSAGAGLLLLASTAMYYAENESQPEIFSSIPAAMWWGVCTLTTVGYGDMYPITLAGRLIGSVIAVLGIGMYALPAGILGSGFMEEFSRMKAGSPTCPHCGESLEKGEDGKSTGPDR